MFTRKLVFSSKFEAHSRKINSICFSNNSKYLASASKDKTIKIWQIKAGKSINTTLFKSDVANSIAFCPDNQTLVSGERNTVKLWSLSAKKLIRILEGHLKTVNSVTVHPNGKLIASASDDRTVKLWSSESGKQICTLTGHTDKVTAVLFSPNGNILASGGDINDKTVKLWFLSQNKSITLKGHSDWFGGIEAIAFGSDSKLIASGSKDKTIKIWRVDTGKEIMTLEGHSDHITSIAISADNKILASSSKDKTLKLWALNTGKLITTVDCNEKIRALTFSLNSQTLALGYSTGDIGLFKPQSKSSNSLQELLN